jgi:hypothetical protein
MAPSLPRPLPRRSSYLDVFLFMFLCFVCFVLFCFMCCGCRDSVVEFGLAWFARRGGAQGAFLTFGQRSAPKRTHTHEIWGARTQHTHGTAHGTAHTAHTSHLHKAGVEHEQLRERLGAVAAADLAPPHLERLQARGVVLRK